MVEHVLCEDLTPVAAVFGVGEDEVQFLRYLSGICDEHALVRSFQGLQPTRGHHDVGVNITMNGNEPSACL